MGLAQPKHAVWHRAQQSHPELEYVRRDLVRIVERAENKRVVRQSAFLARRPTRRDGTAIVIGEIAVWQPDHLLRIEPAVLIGNDGRIGKKIIDEIGSKGPGITEIM